MLGSAVYRQLCSGGWRVDGTQSENPAAPGHFDILVTPREQWAALLGQHYAYVVNCIGILKAAVDEHDRESVARAIRVNALFPHELSALMPDARILHLSTDGVFSGALDRPYLESDPTDCPDTYGKTKALGECPAANVLNFRCSIIGRDSAGGKGLIEWVLRSPDGATLTGFDNHLWNGVTTNQFADLCGRVIRSGAFDPLRAISPVHHFCPNPPITKFDLLRRIREAAGRTISIVRGQSDAPGRRILGTLYSGLPELFGPSDDWETVVGEALKPAPHS